jgi:predicted nucleic acid-binding protein
VKPVLLDTGPIVALLDSSDRFHNLCVQAIAEIGMPLVTCEAVIAESCYLLQRVKGAPEAVLENVAGGVFLIPVSLSQSAREVSRVMQRYYDHKIDLADACLVHLANELGTGDILTLDSDFDVYRWGRRNSFRLLLSYR